MRADFAGDRIPEREQAVREVVDGRLNSSIHAWRTAAFERHVAAAKLPKLNLHRLRNTHATFALRAGVHPKVVSERLGHASVAFTLAV